MITAALILRGDERAIENIITFIEGLSDVSVTYQKRNEGRLYIWRTPPWDTENELQHWTDTEGQRDRYDDREFVIQKRRSEYW